MIVKWIELMETEVSYEGANANNMRDDKEEKAEEEAQEKAEDVQMKDESKPER